MIVHGLWGDTELTRGKIYADVKAALDRHRQWGLCFETYVFGDANEALLRRHGIEVIKLHSDPFVNWNGESEQNPCSREIIHWGVNMWRHKLEIQREALKRHPSIVWMDWDCQQVSVLPNDFSEQFTRGAAVQAVLRQFRRRKCQWRRDGARTLQGGAFVYVRELEILDRALQIQQDHPEWDDEIIWAYLIDERQGGWKGPDTYVRDGYHVPFYHDRRRQIYPPAKPVFVM